MLHRLVSAVAGLVVGVCMLGGAPAAAQTPAATGTIDGTVSSGGATVPGITVELVAEGTRVVDTAIADDAGRFVFERVPPGTYQVRARAEGAAQLSGRPVQVAPDRRESVALTLGISEELSVTAPPPSRTEPTATQSVSADLVQRLAVADDVRALLPLLPGIVRGADGRIQTKGGQPTQGGYQVSGASVTDPSTGDFAFSLPAEAVESVEVLANPFAAEYGRFTSGVTEFRTRRGGDRWGVTPNSFIPKIALRQDSRWALDFRSFTPRVAVSGPLVKDRLFLAQSAHYRFVDTPLTALAGEPTIGLRSFDSFTRLDTADAGPQRLTFGLAIFPRTLEHAGLNAFNPYEVTTTVRQNGFNAGFGHRVVAGAATLVESMVNAKVYNVDIHGEGGTAMVLAPEGNRGSFFNDQRRETTSVQASTAVSQSRSGAGEHLIKAGADVMWSGYEGTSTSRPIDIRRTDGSLGRRIDFGRTSTADVTGVDVAVFGQDRWRVWSPVTIELGLRADRDGVTRKVGVSPRAGVALSPGGQGETVVRAGGGVFYQRTPLNVGAFGSYESRIVTTFGADGRTPISRPQAFSHETLPLDLSRSVVWNAGVDRKLGPLFVLRVSHLRRAGSNEPIVDPVAGPDGSTLRLSSDGRSRYWEQEFTLRYLRDVRHDLSFSYVWSRTRADLNAFDAYFGNARPPIVLPNAYTTASTDVPHRFLAWGTVGVGRRWDVLPLLEIRTGFPYSAVDELQDLAGARNQAGRFPVMASLDLAIQRHLRFAGRDLRVGIRFFNALNRRNYRDVQANTASSSFGRFFNPVERSLGATFWIDR